MAIFHSSAQVISRSAGRSAVAAAAYRASEKIVDERAGSTHDYTAKRGVAHAEIMLPATAPPAFFDRSQLWNAVEAVEKRKDSQLARELNIALPRSLSRAVQIKLARRYVKDTFVGMGMCADLAIHDLESENPHFHVMLSTRDVSPDGFGKKNRTWNNRDLIVEWRKQWANYANTELEKAGIETRIDHRSLIDQGITDRLPGIHLGPQRHAMQKKGIALHTLEAQKQKQLEKRAALAAQEKAEQARLEAIAEVRRLIEKEHAREEAVRADEEAEAVAEATLLAEIEAEKTLSHTIYLGRKLNALPQRRATLNATKAAQIEAITAPVRELKQGERRAYNVVSQSKQQLKKAKDHHKKAHRALEKRLSERHFLVKLLEKIGLRTDKKRHQLQQIHLDAQAAVKDAKKKVDEATATHSQAKAAWASRVQSDLPKRNAILKENADQLAALEAEEKALHAELDTLFSDEPHPVKSVVRPKPKPVETRAERPLETPEERSSDALLDDTPPSNLPRPSF